MPGEIWLTFPDGKEHELEDSVTIGRDETNDLTFGSHTVSREHAAVTLRDGRWYVEDRGSYNGTFLNGVRVQPGKPAAAQACRPDRDRSGDRALLVAGAGAGPGHDRAARRALAGGLGPALGLPAPGGALPVRALARRCKPREPAVERADRGASSARRARPGRSRRRCGASTRRRACRISRRTRSGAPSAASPGSAAGSE